jgi:hypothetical protein
LNAAVIDVTKSRVNKMAMRFQLTPQQRQALSECPTQSFEFEDQETQKVYLVLEQGVLSTLDEAYVRARLEEGVAAIERGEEEEWDGDSIKADGRRILHQRQSRP